MNTPCPDIEIFLAEGLEYLTSIPDQSIDLILTDPPYIISKESGMNTHYNSVKQREEQQIEFAKTEEEWEQYKFENAFEDNAHKKNYMKYGTIYGNKYCVQTDYGEWDSNFTVDILEQFISTYYQKLKHGGTLMSFSIYGKFPI